MSGGMRKRVALAQALILDPPILLMDEPFSALDVQTRQLMENELLRLWQADRKSVMFVTHDLEEAISLADRVVVLSAGPGTHPVAEFAIDLPRPREVSEIRLTPRFLELHSAIWHVLKKEVLKSHAARAGLTRRRRSRARRAALPVGCCCWAIFVLWWVLVELDMLPTFFFGDPVEVAQRLVRLVHHAAASSGISSTR